VVGCAHGLSVFLWPCEVEHPKTGEVVDENRHGLVESVHVANHHRGLCHGCYPFFDSRLSAGHGRPDALESAFAVLALAPGPLVIVERTAVLSFPTTVVSETTVVIPPSAVMTATSLVAPVVSSVASSGSVSSVAPLFLGLLFGTHRNAHTDEGVHVEGPVNMGDVGQGMIGTTDDAVHLSDVRSVVCSHHDGVEGG